MHSYCINKLLNIEDIIVKNVIHFDKFVKIFIETKASPQICPVWGASTSKIHDYRSQEIKDLPLQMKHCYLVLKKRRYSCSCGKRFFEKYSFLPKYFQRTSRLTAFIADQLHNTESIKSIAVKSNNAASELPTQRAVGRKFDTTWRKSDFCQIVARSQLHPLLIHPL